MRITGGELNGRILVAVKGRDIRPTSSKVRQAVFNIIGNDISGFHIIDIFAGTGIMGIEALSRGGEWALFLDSSGSSIGLIKKNLEICGLADKGYIIKGDIGKGFIRQKSPTLSGSRSYLADSVTIFESSAMTPLLTISSNTFGIRP